MYRRMNKYVHTGTISGIGGGTAKTGPKRVSCTAEGICAFCPSVKFDKNCRSGSRSSVHILRASLSWGAGNCISTAKLWG